MLIDNKIQKKDRKYKKVIELIIDKVANGRLDIVTGYFTIGALAYLSECIRGETEFRIIPGQMVRDKKDINNLIKVVLGNITASEAFKLSETAKNAIAFLKRDDVKMKTIQKSFCHAKAYVYSDRQDMDNNFYVVGSSNLTSAGLGIHDASSNIELNYADRTRTNDFDEAQEWFDMLWRDVAMDTIKLDTGERKDFKQYIIECIENFTKKYTPEEMYYKVLFELFKRDLDNLELDARFLIQVGHLRGTRVWNALYGFQQSGVMSLIKMIKTYGGAIMADAVGLGKTWQALAVMKYFQLEGNRVILICPKKLQQNWESFLPSGNSKFEEDRLEYVIRFHSDLQTDRMDKDRFTMSGFFTNDDPKLIVIDESHHFRNDKSQRYSFLLDKLICANKNVKVLLLSATPINNSLNDVRNQFKLLVKGQNGGYTESLGIPGLQSLFANANQAFNKWKGAADNRLSAFLAMLKPDFFRLMDATLVSRTRSIIAEIEPNLKFPHRNSTPDDNQYITPENIGDFRSFDQLLNALPPYLSAYSPALYIDVDEKPKSSAEDEQQRDRFLVKMMHFLLVKRLESSWHSLLATAETVREHHRGALKKLHAYRGKRDELLEEGTMSLEELLEEEESDLTGSGFSLGKREIRFADIEKSGKLKRFEKDLTTDLAALDLLIVNLAKFKLTLTDERSDLSKDTKLERLIALIRKKQASGKNVNNQKVVIFTCYKDTAFYLFDEFKNRGLERFAAVAGDGSRLWDEDGLHRKFDTVLERFAPMTKLMGEKQWPGFTLEKEESVRENYSRWTAHIAQTGDDKTKDKLARSIDLLIATDCLSEGQNFQDADMVINYDVHWNPVRVLQRAGRIDRIGSPNLQDGISAINFWPCDSIEKYIKLQKRVEDRMVQMRVTGAEVDAKFSAGVQKRMDDDAIETSNRNKMLSSMELGWEDLDGAEKPFGFDDFSMETFRQELYDLLSKEDSKWKEIPYGVGTGFIAKPDLFSGDVPRGTIALMGYPAAGEERADHEYTEHLLAFAGPEGEVIPLNQKDILNLLRHHKGEDTYLPPEIESGKPEAIARLTTALNRWMDAQIGTKSNDEVLKLMQTGNLSLTASDREEQQRIDEKYRVENFDLLHWFIVS